MQTNDRRERQKIMMKGVKPKAWSHQNELAALKGKQILVCLGNVAHSFQLEGELLEADQFTLKVRRKGTSFDVVVHKSAVIYWHEVKKNVREGMN